MPQVSIIVPTKNRSELLMQTLASVRGQTLGDFECIVVDDNSTDDTAARIQPILAEDPRISFMTVPLPRSGAQAARNLGIESARGEYIILLDSDDLLAPHCLAQRVPLMQANPALDFAVFPCECFTKTPGDKALLWNVETPEPDLDRFLKLDVPWQTTSPIWRRASIVSLLPWPEDVPVAQDWEFHIRALLRGMNYARFGRVDHYWRVAESERESIGKNSFKPEMLQKRVGVNERVLGTVRQAGAMTDARREYFAGMFFQSAERIAERASRRDARANRTRARELQLITPREEAQGNRYLMLHRFPALRGPMRRRLQRKWPAAYFVQRSSTYLRAPAPKPAEAA
jgi:glycosyltransferase involved in cell wall biosynthesis